MLPGTLLTLVYLAGSAAAQGFWDSCSQWQLGWDRGEPERILKTYMVAECTDRAGETRYSILPINDCLANLEGKMTPARKGFLSLSCIDCTWEESNLTCGCHTTGGDTLTSTVDLNTVIRNVNGIIGCYDFVGIEVSDMDAMPF